MQQGVIFLCPLHRRGSHCTMFQVCKLLLYNEIPVHLKPPSKIQDLGFPGGAVVENLPANAGDMGSSPGLGRSHMPRSN